MKLFRATTTVEDTKGTFVDWFRANNQEEARAGWETEAKACGVPVEKATVEFTECDTETLKPV